jgi:hypothetical protein
MHISLTALKPKGIISYFKFWLLAIPSFQEAKKANGILFCEVKKMHGNHCTITAWESRAHMLQFMRSGVHLKAMKAFGNIATGKTYGYEPEEIPTWENAYALLATKGKDA